jgi:hypothetical protein
LCNKAPRGLKRFALIVAASLGPWFPSPLAGQGVTTATIRGTVSGPSDVDGTMVSVVNVATGYSTETKVRGGFFVVPGLETGGPYTIGVRRLGYVPQQQMGLYLALGERRDVDFTLVAVATRLDTVTVAAEKASAPVAAAGGVGTSISDSALHRLPTLNGVLYDFVRLVPQVSTPFGPSGGGASFRLNNYVIDGVSDRQLQGNTTLGGGNGSKGISLEAVKEYQVLLTPFDVQYGDFTGLLVNSVTKSGTNNFHGSAYGYLRDAKLARGGSFLGTSAYDRELYGFSLGGPIIRDHVHFFVAPEFQRAASPARGPYVGQSIDATLQNPVPADGVARFASLLRD